MNYVTAEEITAVKDLLDLLNNNLESRIIDAEVALGDSNGEPIGKLIWSTTTLAYVWEFPEEGE